MSTRATGVRAKKVKAEGVEPSSGNVFADLGLPDAEQRLLKAQLAMFAFRSRNASRRRHTRESCSLSPFDSRRDSILHTP